MSHLSGRTTNILINTYKQKYLKVLSHELEMHTLGIKVKRNIIYVMDETNVAIWYGLIFNLDDDGVFANGQYIIELKASDDYPQKPPVFRYLTPNGVFNNNSAPCISIGHYHSNNYPAAIGMPGFGEAVREAMRGYADLNDGISIIKTNDNDKRTYANESIAYNRTHHQYIICMFQKHIQDTHISAIVPNI